MLNYLRKPAGKAEHVTFGVPDRDAVPPGGATVDGVISRSDSVIRQRWLYLTDNIDRLFNEREALVRAAEMDMQDVEAARNALAADPTNQLATDKLARANARLDATNAKTKKNIAMREVYTKLRNSAQGYIQPFAGDMELRVNRPDLDPPASGQWRDTYDGGECVALRKQREEKRSAAPLEEVVLQKLRRHHATIAASGEPTVVGLYGESRKGIRIELPKMNLNAEPNAFGAEHDRFGKPRVIDIEALAYRYFGDKILADAEAQVRAFYADLDVEPLSAEERHRQIRKLDAEIAKAERIELEAFHRAVAAGEDVELRDGISPAAYLGIA
jgi:hypothetical protein